MQKVKNTEDSTEVEVIDVPESEVSVDESKKLTMRDALEVGIAAAKDKEKNADAGRDGAAPGSDPGQRKETKQGADSTREVADKDRDKDSSKKFEPPAEYTPEEKADFLELSPKGQEAQLRLHRSRLSKVEEIKREQADLAWVKELSGHIEPYLKVQGEKRPAHEALILALKMHKELSEGDPKKAAADYLRSRGVEPPAALLEGSEEKESDPKITTLQNELNDVKSKLAREDQAKVQTVLHSVWSEFEGTKNAAGKPKFPDVGNTESGLKLASNIGSLVGGQTDLSKQFIAQVKTRIPGANHQTLLTEAYKWLGGRVDEVDATKSQATQNQLRRSNRAASSTPGRGVGPTSNGAVKKFKSRREALEAAVADLREQEG